MALLASLYLLWLLWAHKSQSGLHVSADTGKPGEILSATGFHYTEYFEGQPVYEMSGKEIHDEHARIGSMRISAVKMVYVRQPVVKLLQPGAGQGWVLTATEGKMVGSQKRLILRGHVRGIHSTGGTLQANEAVVDVKQASVQLKGGYEINTSRRKEHGIQTRL